MEAIMYVVAAMGIASIASASPGTTPEPKSAPVNGPGPGAVAIYRGEKLIGWVTPDPDRLERPKAAATKSKADKAKAKQAVRTTKSKAAKGKQKVGTVGKIKDSFRKATGSRMFRKPQWVRQGSSEFSDRRVGRNRR
jgi:hypothetical protein